MVETREQREIRRSPLDEIHERLGALMKNEGEWVVPASYGDAAAEYEAVRGGGAGLIDLSSRGRIEVTGSEAVQFLNGLITNDVKTLAENSWMRAAFPNAQGRLIAEARVMRLGADKFLFDTEAATHERILKTLARFTLAGDFHLTDLTSETALISLQGASAAQVVSDGLTPDAARVELSRVALVEWQGQTLHVIRATRTAEDGFEFLTSAAGAASVWESLAGAGARPVGHEALDVLRVETGIARYDVDMDETNVVLEAPLDDAVSFTKGCYIGQEIIARIHWRGHVAKKLAGLSFEGREEIGRNDKVRTAEGKEIGRITSATFSPRINRTIALAYIKYDYLAFGTEVRVRSGEEGVELRAEVSELPFVRGSWVSASQEIAETKA